MMKKAMIWGISLAFVVTGVQAQSLDDAKRAIDAEQFAKAKDMLETLVKNQSKRGINYFYLGLVYLHNDHIDSAATIFEQGLAADPKTNLNKVGQGIVDLHKGNESAANTKFSEATGRLKKKDYLELYHIGRAYIDAPTPNYQKAVEYLEQAKVRNVKDALIPLSLGDAYFGLSNASMAYKNYRDAFILDNSLIRAQVQMAVIKRRSHAWQEAIDDLNQIASQHPNYAPTFRELAETYHAWAHTATAIEDYNARNKQAVEYYKQYMDKTDYSVESRIRYADFLVFAKDYDELQVQASELAQLEDVNPKILRYLGYTAYEKGQYQESKDALDRMFTRMEEDRIISRDYLHLGMADIKVAEANNDEALFNEGIQQLRKAVLADSSIADDLHDVGTEFFGKKQFKRALEVFDIAASTPTSRNYIYDNYYAGLAGFYEVYYLPAEQQTTPEAKAILQRADKAFALVTEKAPNTKEAYLQRAEVNKLLDDAENPQGLAIPHFEKYIELVKADGEAEVAKNRDKLVGAYSTIAVTYVRQGAYQKGRDTLGEVLKLDPGNEWAKQTLQYLEQETSASNR